METQSAEKMWKASQYDFMRQLVYKLIQQKQWLFLETIERPSCMRNIMIWWSSEIEVHLSRIKLA